MILRELNASGQHLFSNLIRRFVNGSSLSKKIKNKKKYNKALKLSTTVPH